MMRHSGVSALSTQGRPKAAHSVCHPLNPPDIRLTHSICLRQPGGAAQRPAARVCRASNFKRAMPAGGGAIPIAGRSISPYRTAAGCGPTIPNAGPGRNPQPQANRTLPKRIPAVPTASNEE
jgi:hypothetical protein